MYCTSYSLRRRLTIRDGTTTFLRLEILVSVYAWGDIYVTLLTTANAAMWEVYDACISVTYVVIFHNPSIKLSCVELHTSRKTQGVNNLFRFCILTMFFVDTEYTAIMAASYAYDVQ